MGVSYHGAMLSPVLYPIIKKPWKGLGKEFDPTYLQSHLWDFSQNQRKMAIERAWSRDHATSSVTAVLPPPGQRCGTVCLNSSGNRTSPLDNSNDR